MARELAVISGKGGTGKTSIVASFAALAAENVLADCDVDAADLHLVLNPTVLKRESFVGGKKASIRNEDCSSCGKCLDLCRYGAVLKDGRPDTDQISFRIDGIACEGCGVCAHFCPEDAIDFREAVCGEWFISETRHGPMVHAHLRAAAENSGRLVSLVRKNAKGLAENRKLDLIIIDGPPGIGCPVIASVAGTSLILAVTEPTLPGKHDLERVSELAAHFDIPIGICINKWDLNAEIATKITEYAQSRRIPVLGRVRYHTDVTRAQVSGTSVVEYTDGPVAADVEDLWRSVAQALERR